LSSIRDQRTKEQGNKGIAKKVGRLYLQIVGEKPSEISDCGLFVLCRESRWKNQILKILFIDN